MSSKSQGQKRKAKNKHWYRLQEKRKKGLNPGLKGFLLFCNRDERKTIREAYILLNEFADRMYGTEAPSSDAEIDDLLEKEKTALKLEEKAERRFQLVDSGVQNVLFVRTTVPDPLAIVERILRDVCSKQEQRTRFLIRLIPVQITCKAYEDNVKEAFKKAINSFLTESVERQDVVTYQVLFKSRCNQNLSKEAIIRMVRDVVASDAVAEMGVAFKPNLENPDLCFNFEVMKANCCLGILPDYLKYRKYNLIELGQRSAREVNPKIAGDEGSGDEPSKEVLPKESQKEPEDPSSIITEAVSSEQSKEEVSGEAPENVSDEANKDVSEGVFKGASNEDLQDVCEKVFEDVPADVH